MAQLLSQDAQVAVTTANLLERLDLERLDISNRLARIPAAYSRVPKKGSPGRSSTAIVTRPRAMAA